MSFSSILAKIKHKDSTPDRVSERPQSTPARFSNSTVKQNSAPKSTNNDQNYTVRKVDPAVQRLKELRRLEKEQKEAAAKEKAAQSRTVSKPRARSRAKSAPASKSSTASAAHAAYNQLEEQRRSASPVKRLSFKELMEEAKGKTKQLSMASTSPDTKAPEIAAVTPKIHQRKSTAPVSHKVSKPSQARRPVVTNAQRPKKQIIAPTAPKPLAQPSSKLKAKLEARRANSVSKQSVSRRRSQYDEDEYGYEDDEEDDFIVDDDEEEIEEEAGAYDRDEIWQMFNRGKKRSDYRDYDDDLSDMEATGSEILKEESRSEKRARLEEQAEKERERRRLEEKRKRLGQR